jgi:hypothetical protein
MIRHVVVTAAAMLFVAAGTAFAQDAKPPAMSHDMEGKENCLMCHSGAMEGIPGVPDGHEAFETGDCLMCHAPDAEVQTADAPAIPHDLEGKDNCAMCHSGAMEGIPAEPASHEGRETDTCQWCHKPAG